MGADFAQEFPFARALYEEADRVLGWSVSTLSFEGPQETLNDTRYTQPALFVHSVAAAEMLREHGVHPDVVAGHSLGEYAALVAAGTLRFGDGLCLVSERAAAMAEAAAAQPGTMAAVVGLDCEAVSAAIAGIDGVVAANYNAPDQVVISGTLLGVQTAGETLSALGAKRVLPLKVSGAFHSPLMGPAAHRFKKTLDTIELCDARVPVIPNVTAEPTQDRGRIRDLLVEQITSPVQWTNTMRCLASLGVGTCYETGPGKVLQGLMRRAEPDIVVKSGGSVNDIRACTQK
jgi:[acyl-carrier-protein] S-malonyltransferase